MHRKALIAIAVGSILGGAAYRLPQANSQSPSRVSIVTLPLQAVTGREWTARYASDLVHTGGGCD